MFSLDQYNALRGAAGIVDRSQRGKVAVLGKDRATYLQGLLTNDIQALKPGRGCYAAYLTPQGRMITDARVIELGDRLLLDLSAGVKDAVLAKLDELIFTEDVQLEDLTDVWAEYGVHGPRAAQAVAAALAAGAPHPAAAPSDRELAAFEPYQNGRWMFHGAPVIVVRDDWTGETGFDLYVEGALGPALHDALAGAGAADVNPVVADVVRIEAGRPEFPADMDAETIPLEAGIEDRAISFSKGCYVGQEVIIRVLHRGHGRVARKLVGLTIQDSGNGDRASPPDARTPSAGDRLFVGGKEIGRITSAAFSPAVQAPIALGYVQRELTAPGTSVEVRHEGWRAQATVTELPFVERSPRRHRDTEVC